MDLKLKKIITNKTKIMTAKEKAKEIYMKYLDYTHVKYEHEYTKQCALICIDEILSQINNWGIISVKGYWTEVKKEIELL